MVTETLNGTAMTFSSSSFSEALNEAVMKL
jgi:hypothetical protein